MRTTDRTPSGSVADSRAVESHVAAVPAGSAFADAVLRLQSTIGNAAVGRMLARRALTADERKHDARELKQAKRRAGMLRRWVERLEDGALDPTPANKRRARWALLLDGA